MAAGVELIGRSWACGSCLPSMSTLGCFTGAQQHMQRGGQPPWATATAKRDAQQQREVCLKSHLEVRLDEGPEDVQLLGQLALHVGLAVPAAEGGSRTEVARASMPACCLRVWLQSRATRRPTAGLRRPMHTRQPKRRATAAHAQPGSPSAGLRRPVTEECKGKEPVEQCKGKQPLERARGMLAADTGGAPAAA